MKKRFLRIGLALTAILLAVGLAGCPTPDDPTDKQTGAVLELIAIGNLADVYPIDSATTEAAVLVADFSGATEIPLTATQKNGAIKVGLTSTSDKARVEIAQIATPHTAAPSYSTALTGLTFADEDWLVIKVTSEDGNTVNFYRFNITLGRNAVLAGVTIGTTAQNSETYLGKPANEIANAEPGDFQTDPAPTTFLLLAEDEDATVNYAFVNGATPPADAAFIAFSGTTAIALPDTVGNGTNLYIKVVSTNEQNTLYYVMKLIFPQLGSITYGVPKLVDPANPGDPFYIDPIWDSVDWDFPIDRANQAESVAAYFKETYGKHTSARAKAMWDDNGIWVLVDVDVSKYSETSGGAEKDRPLVSGTDHVADSVEIFINERQQLLGTPALVNAGGTANTNMGNQFRVGIANDRSGETAAALTASNTNGEIPLDEKPTLAPFTDPTYAKTRTVLKKPAGHGNTAPANYATTLAEATNGGYIIIGYAPFKLKASDNANAVFDADGKVKDGAKIGFELQLNCNSGTGRDGILTWNGYNTQAYNNAAGYGIVTLNRDSKAEDATVFPEITAQSLSNASYAADATVTALSVTTTGSIQWFKAASLYGAGTAIGSATSASYTPELAEGSDVSYYYAVVTAGGVSVVTNRRAMIRTYGDDEGKLPPRVEPFTEKIVNIGTSVPVYGFDIGTKTLGDFEKVVIDIKLDAESPNNNGRIRAWGSYASALEDGKTWTNGQVGMNNNDNATGALLNANGAADIAADDFNTIDIAFAGRAAYEAQSDATGLILLGIGPVPPAGGSGNYTYYLANIKLVASDGTEVLAIHPEDTAMLAGLGNGAFVSQDFSAGQVVTRELISLEWEEKLTMINTSVPVYGFNLPAGKTFGDYDRIVLKMKFDPESPAKNARLRAWGNYDLSTWTNVVDNRPGMQNATPGGLLLNAASEVNYADVTDWTEYTIEFTGRDALTTAADIKAASGIVAIGIGAVPPGGGSGTRIFYFKDIVLSNTDGSETVPALKPDSVLLWGGAGASAFVTQDPSNDSVTRELQ